MFLSLEKEVLSLLFHTSLSVPDSSAVFLFSPYLMFPWPLHESICFFSIRQLKQSNLQVLLASFSDSNQLTESSDKGCEWAVARAGSAKGKRWRGQYQQRAVRCLLIALWPVPPGQEEFQEMLLEFFCGFQRSVAFTAKAAQESPVTSQRQQHISLICPQPLPTPLAAPCSVFLPWLPAWFCCTLSHRHQEGPSCCSYLRGRRKTVHLH